MQIRRRSLGPLIGKLPFRTMPFKGGARLIGQYDYTVP